MLETYPPSLPYMCMVCPCVEICGWCKSSPGYTRRILMGCRVTRAARAASFPSDTARAANTALHLSRFIYFFSWQTSRSCSLLTTRKKNTQTKTKQNQHDVFSSPTQPSKRKPGYSFPVLISFLFFFLSFSISMSARGGVLQAEVCHRVSAAVSPRTCWAPQHTHNAPRIGVAPRFQQDTNLDYLTLFLFWSTS